MGILDYFKKKEGFSLPREALAAELAQIKRKVEGTAEAVRELKDANAVAVSLAIMLILTGFFSIFSMALVSLGKGITAMAIGAPAKAATPNFMASIMLTMFLMMLAYLSDEKKGLN